MVQVQPIRRHDDDYNGYDGTTNPQPRKRSRALLVPLRTLVMYNGGNEWDIDSDGDSPSTDWTSTKTRTAKPDWWDQDEGNDGIMDVNDVKMGGTFNMSVCGHTVGNLAKDLFAVIPMPLHIKCHSMALMHNLVSRIQLVLTLRSTRCNSRGQSGTGPAPALRVVVGTTLGGDGVIDSAVSFTQMQNNRAFVMID